MKQERIFYVFKKVSPQDPGVEAVASSKLRRNQELENVSDKTKWTKYGFYTWLMNKFRSISRFALTTCPLLYCLCTFGWDNVMLYQIKQIRDWMKREDVKKMLQTVTHWIIYMTACCQFLCLLAASPFSIHPEVWVVFCHKIVVLGLCVKQNEKNQKTIWNLMLKFSPLFTALLILNELCCKNPHPL